MQILSKNQHGQAMTEFVIGSILFLMPLFLIIPMLGKYSDVKAASAQTARYVAWERTVWYGGSAASVTWPGNSKSEADIKNEARRRVTSFGGTIASTDKNANSFNQAGGRNIWHNRDGSAMLKTWNDASISNITNSNSPDTVTGTVLGAVTAVTSITGFRLETKGLYAGSADISITTKPIGTQLDGSTTGRFDPGLLHFVDSNVILANGWGANGSAHVKTQTAGLAPLGLVGDSAIAPVLQIAGCAALAAFAPEFCFLEIGKIMPDVVPPDRITN
ncbi:MAG TPA: hypothetical protein VK949_04870 [Methylotenera sp.]|nr:hypothetical protein [Methylotenera sp.]